MENSRLIKEYIFYPLIIGFIIFSFLHYHDSSIKNIEKSVLFGLQFASGFAILSGLITISAVKYLRPFLSTTFGRHRNLENLVNYGFKWNDSEKYYEGKIEGYETFIFYTYQERNILKSEYHIVVKFQLIPKEKFKQMKPRKRFANTVIFPDFIQGNHDFILMPIKTEDLIEDVHNFCSYLKENNINSELNN